MKAHQRIIREKKSQTAKDENLFGAWWESLDTSIEMAELKKIDIKTATSIIEEYEWLGCMAAGTMRCYGIFWDGNCGGVVCYGVTTTKTLAESICGKEMADKVAQLQRGACVHWAHPHSASKLISYSLKQEEKHGTRIVVAFSDPMAGEIGTVYQATNWLYCGKTEKRPDYFDPNGNRITGQVGEIKEWMVKKDRPRKQRYIYILGSKKERREIAKKLAWTPQKYPKRNALEVSIADTPCNTSTEGVGQFHDNAPISIPIT